MTAISAPSPGGAMWRNFDFRYSNRLGLGVKDTMRTDEALSGIGDDRRMYRWAGKSA